jgi:hypothetical protein
MQSLIIVLICHCEARWSWKLRDFDKSFRRINLKNLRSSIKQNIETLYSLMDFQIVL